MRRPAFSQGRNRIASEPLFFWCDYFRPDDACLRGDMISFIYQLLADETEAATRDNALQAISRLAGETLQPAGMSRDGFTAGDMYLLLDALMDACWYDPDHVEAQVAVPHILSLDASDQADAEQQIAQALQYAPQYIYLTMSAPGAGRRRQPVS